MAKSQSAMLDRKKLMADPIMVLTIVVLITFLTLFILYPLAILLVDSFYGGNGFTLATFQRIMAMPNFITAITNTLKVGFLVGILSTIVGLLFAYVEVYVRVGKAVGGLFKVVSMLPVVSPPFVLSLSMIMLFGKAGLITRFLLGIYDNNVYGFWGIVIVQTLTFFPVCYMMLKGLLKNIDPSLEEAARDMGCEVTPLSVVARRIFLGAGHPLAAKDALTPEDLKTICIAYYSGSLSHLTGHYSPHFAGEYRLANREDVLDLVVRNEAAVILPGSLFRHDERVRKGELVEKAIPLPGMEHTAPITAIRLPELSFAERLFWDYLIENFAGSL